MPLRKGPQKQNNQKQTKKTPTQRMKETIRSQINERKSFKMFL